VAENARGCGDARGARWSQGFDPLRRDSAVFVRSAMPPHRPIL